MTLLFSRLHPNLRAVDVVVGQSLGFAVLVLVSLSAFLGREIVPLSWLGLLGLLPISLGVSGLLEGLSPLQSDPVPIGTDIPRSDQLAAWPTGPAPDAPNVSPLLAVVSLTVANGSDNVGVYMPLFARASAPELALILLTFGLGLVLWCLLAWWLTRLPGLAWALRHRGRWLVPTVLIGLGALVLIDSHCLEQPVLALISFGSLAVMTWSLLRWLAVAAAASRPWEQTSALTATRSAPAWCPPAESCP